VVLTPSDDDCCPLPSLFCSGSFFPNSTGPLSPFGGPRRKVSPLFRRYLLPPLCSLPPFSGSAFSIFSPFGHRRAREGGKEDPPPVSLQPSPRFSTFLLIRSLQWDIVFSCPPTPPPPMDFPLCFFSRESRHSFSSHNYTGFFGCRTFLPTFSGVCLSNPNQPSVRFSA